MRLVECYLAVGDDQSARNLATHLIPLAALRNDRANLTTLYTARCMSHGAMLTVELARRELDECVRECARLTGSTSSQLVQAGRMDAALYATVCELLDAAGDRARLSLWRDAWSRLAPPNGANKSVRRGGFLRPRVI